MIGSFLRELTSDCPAVSGRLLESVVAVRGCVILSTLRVDVCTGRRPAAGRLAAVSLKRVSRRELTGVVDCECECENKRESHAQHRPDAEEGPADARVCVVLREWRLTAVPAVIDDAALQREAEGGDRIPGADDCNARTYSSKMSMIRKAESLARV